MPSIDHFGTFIAASLLLLVVPGPAVVYIATRSASQGRAAGLVSVAGIATGGLVHVIGAAVGVSAILAKSAIAMQYVRWFGAAYLIYLGIQKLREASSAAAPVETEARRSPLRKIYKDGVIVNVFNPKTALFFLAFLPQFGTTLPQLLLLGTTFVVLAVITDSAYALAAAGIASAARRHARFSRAGAYLSSAVYIGLGLATAAQARAK